MPVLLATADWEAAQPFADDGIILNQGKVTASGSVENLLGEPHYRVETADTEAAASALKSRKGISDVKTAGREASAVSFSADDAKTAAAAVAELKNVKNFESVRPTLAEQYKEAL